MIENPYIHKGLWRLPAFLLAGILALTGCTVQTVPAGVSLGGRETAVLSPAKPAQADAPADPLRAGHSGYGRSTLPSKLWNSYDALAEGLLTLEERVAVSFETEEELTRTILCVLRDYPIISWMSSSYSYERMGNSITGVYFEFTKTPEEAAAEAAAVYAAGKKLTEHIDPALPDFDRALLVYDRLCTQVEYDLQAPHRDDVSGALCEGRATCGGYAKAYQYALLLLDMEALMVYGEAGEPHAWNIVALDGNYYQVDPTWGSAVLSTGERFLSHEFLFLNDADFLESHSSYGEEQNYPLPACTAVENNYFVKKGLLVENSSPQALKSCLESAAVLAAANRYSAVQIRFSSQAAADDFSALSQDADLLMQKLAAGRGMLVSGRSYSETGRVLTYFITEKSS